MIKILLFISIIFFKLSVKQVLGLNCSKPCNQNDCSPPTNCFSGFVKDKCNCCYVCGQLEGQRCFNSTLKELPKSFQRYPFCGEFLSCELRDDMAEGDQIEAICVCQSNEPICGSDGKTYENLCKFTEARYKKRDELTLNSRSPCKIAPKIITKPSSINNLTNSNVAFSCEASGYPIPTIEWKFTPKNISINRLKRSYKQAAILNLPSDDPHIAIQSRGGPNTYEVTSWLQILRIQSLDAGQYHCVALNSEGEDSATGELIIYDSNDLENKIIDIK